MNNQRPLSPHLSIYCWEWPMIYSIAQRIFGVLLGVGLIFFLVLFSMAAFVPHLLRWIFVYLTNPWTLSIWIPYSFALFFFIFGGIRHLLWDFVIGLELPVASKTGHITFFISLLCTITFWYEFLI